jgi:hypothetical protein
MDLHSIFPSGVFDLLLKAYSFFNIGVVRVSSETETMYACDLS